MLHQLNSYDAEQKISVLQNNVGHLTHTISNVSQKIFLMFEQGAKGTVYLQDDSSVQKAMIEYHITLEKYAQFDFLATMINSSHLSVMIYVYLKGDGAQASIKGIYALSGDQNVSIKTFQYHTGPRTKSDVLMKGMLKDRGQALYEGLIFIGEHGKKTEASLENKNILLSKQAKVISIPSIEVLQHDVQCSHGSAIGKFDEDQLWYLQSRGFTKQKAYELLVESFFKEIMQGFEDKKVMEKLCQKMI